MTGLRAVATHAQLRAVWPDLRGVAIVGLDLRHEDYDWSRAEVAETLFFGCVLPDGEGERLANRGAVVVMHLDDLPFPPFRTELYTYDELTASDGSTSAATLDARAGTWFQRSSSTLAGTAVRALHDAGIDAAVVRFVAGRRVVGVMGGHAAERGAPLYRDVAHLGRALTRGGFTVATGGGPGVMEAANLGAWMARASDGAFEDALTLLATAPSYHGQPDAYVEAARAVRRRWPVGGESLGVPTWLYLDEPTSAFASHIAKYFTNSIRENGLLAIARSGVVYAPGGPGTLQELFTDTAQNSLTLYEVRSPLVFLGRAAHERNFPELVTLARRQAAAFGWDELVAVCDTPDEVVAFVTAHDPDRDGGAGAEPRRARTGTADGARVQVRAPAEATPFREAFARIRSEFEVPAAFAPPVEAEAEAAVARGPVPPPDASRERVDQRAVPFVTIDPPGSRDLDQAYHAERRGDGYRVRYAIADVAAFVAPGSLLDRESWARGVTIYMPDGRAPMLPNRLGEGAASLLPEQDRAALVWTIDLDATGETTDARLVPGTVRSRAALDYPSVQAALDAGRADEPIVLLREIGMLLLERERERGGVSLDLPQQEVVAMTGGRYALEYEAPLPVERWNAQISLLAGRQAAALMIDAHVGIVRTVPPPAPDQIRQLRRRASALRVAWPKGAPWGDVVRSLDRSKATDAAFLKQAAHLLRNAGYAVLDASNTIDAASVPVHAGVAAPYAHVTAPLRRLADRYANEIVVAHCVGADPPGWARDALPELVKTMQSATHHSAAIERAVVDAVECAVLAQHAGEEFGAVVVDVNRRGVLIQLRDVAIVAMMSGRFRLGADLRVRVGSVDPIVRHIELAPVAAGSSGAERPAT